MKSAVYEQIYTYVKNLVDFSEYILFYNEKYEKYLYDV